MGAPGARRGAGSYPARDKRGVAESYPARDKRRVRQAAVWWGVVSAVIVSVVAGVALQALGIAFEGRGEEHFEGITMLLAAGVLTWMIFWMQRQRRWPWPT